MAPSIRRPPSALALACLALVAACATPDSAAKRDAAGPGGAADAARVPDAGFAGPVTTGDAAAEPPRGRDAEAGVGAAVVDAGEGGGTRVDAQPPKPALPDTGAGGAIEENGAGGEDDGAEAWRDAGAVPSPDAALPPPVDDCSACGPDERCLPGPEGGAPFCTRCDPDTCGLFAALCCPGNAASGECTLGFTDAENCGGCGVRCGVDELCIRGACALPTEVRACTFDPMQWWSSPETQDDRDITFVAFADTHATEAKAGCGSVRGFHIDGNERMRVAINALIPSVFWRAHLWPDDPDVTRAGLPFDHVRGAIIAGDLTQSGDESIPAGTTTCRQYRAYRDAFGACGDEGRLSIPVYDGYGNHDFPRVAGVPGEHFHPVVDALDARSTPFRPGGVTEPDDVYDDPEPGTGHYAWRWDDIWFVMLDLEAGNDAQEMPSDEGMRVADPHRALRFLRSFLETRTDSRRRRIVLISHFHFDAADNTDDEHQRLCEILDDARRGTGDFTGPKLAAEYPVVAHLHGHNHHAPEREVWQCPAPYAGISIPTYSVGTPLYSNPHNDGRLQFTVFRLGNTRVEAVGFGAPADDPTGAWDVIYTHRASILEPP